MLCFAHMRVALAWLRRFLGAFAAMEGINYRWKNTFIFKLLSTRTKLKFLRVGEIASFLKITKEGRNDESDQQCICFEHIYCPVYIECHNSIDPKHFQDIFHDGVLKMDSIDVVC